MRHSISSALIFYRKPRKPLWHIFSLFSHSLSFNHTTGLFFCIYYEILWSRFQWCFNICLNINKSLPHNIGVHILLTQWDNCTCLWCSFLFQEFDKSLEPDIIRQIMAPVSWKWHTIFQKKWKKDFVQEANDNISPCLQKNDSITDSICSIFFRVTYLLFVIFHKQTSLSISNAKQNWDSQPKQLGSFFWIEAKHLLNYF